MPLTPEQRQVLGPFLEIYELTREPAEFARWIQTNELMTALAHLVGTDGEHSYLLRCLATGVLRVDLASAGATALSAAAWGALRSVPPWLAAAPAGADSDEISDDATATVDFGAAAPRLVRVSIDANIIRCYDSTSSGGATAVLGVVSVGSGPVVFRTVNRYFDMHAALGASYYLMRYWE